MRYTTTVKLVLAESPTSTVPNVKIALYDRDRFTPDDLLGTTQTDANGEARFDYTTEQFEDLDEKLGGSMPELYAVVYDSKGAVVLSTRADAQDGTHFKRMTVELPQELAKSHGLTAGV
jgi:hypothetical protein